MVTTKLTCVRIHSGFYSNFVVDVGVPRIFPLACKLGQGEHFAPVTTLSKSTKSCGLSVLKHLGHKFVSFLRLFVSSSAGSTYLSLPQFSLTESSSSNSSNGGEGSSSRQRRKKRRSRRSKKNRSNNNLLSDSTSSNSSLENEPSGSKAKGKKHDSKRATGRNDSEKASKLLTWSQVDRKLKNGWVWDTSYYGMSHLGYDYIMPDSIAENGNMLVNYNNQEYVANTFIGPTDVMSYKFPFMRVVGVCDDRDSPKPVLACASSVSLSSTKSLGGTVEWIVRDEDNDCTLLQAYLPNAVPVPGSLIKHIRDQLLGDGLARSPELLAEKIGILMKLALKESYIVHLTDRQKEMITKYIVKWYTNDLLVKMKVRNDSASAAIAVLNYPLVRKGAWHIMNVFDFGCSVVGAFLEPFSREWLAFTMGKASFECFMNPARWKSILVGGGIDATVDIVLYELVNGLTLDSSFRLGTLLFPLLKKSLNVMLNLFSVVEHFSAVDRVNWVLHGIVMGYSPYVPWITLVTCASYEAALYDLIGWKGVADLERDQSILNDRYVIHFLCYKMGPEFHAYINACVLENRIPDLIVAVDKAVAQYVGTVFAVYDDGSCGPWDGEPNIVSLKELWDVLKVQMSVYGPDVYSLIHTVSLETKKAYEAVSRIKPNVTLDLDSPSPLKMWCPVACNASGDIREGVSVTWHKDCECSAGRDGGWFYGIGVVPDFGYLPSRIAQGGHSTFDGLRRGLCPTPTLSDNAVWAFQEWLDRNPDIFRCGNVFIKDYDTWNYDQYNTNKLMMNRNKVVIDQYKIDGRIKLRGKRRIMTKNDEFLFATTPSGHAPSTARLITMMDTSMKVALGPVIGAVEKAGSIVNLIDLPEEPSLSNIYKVWGSILDLYPDGGVLNTKGTNPNQLSVLVTTFNHMGYMAICADGSKFDAHHANYVHVLYYDYVKRLLNKPDKLATFTDHDLTMVNLALKALRMQWEDQKWVAADGSFTVEIPGALTSLPTGTYNTSHGNHFINGGITSYVWDTLLSIRPYVIDDGDDSVAFVPQELFALATSQVSEAERMFSDLGFVMKIKVFQLAEDADFCSKNFIPVVYDGFRVLTAVPILSRFLWKHGWFQRALKDSERLKVINSVATGIFTNYGNLPIFKAISTRVIDLTGGKMAAKVFDPYPLNVHFNDYDFDEQTFQWIFNHWHISVSQLARLESTIAGTSLGNRIKFPPVWQVFIDLVDNKVPTMLSPHQVLESKSRAIRALEGPKWLTFPIRSAPNVNLWSLVVKHQNLNKILIMSQNIKNLENQVAELKKTNANLKVENNSLKQAKGKGKQKTKPAVAQFNPVPDTLNPYVQLTCTAPRERVNINVRGRPFAGEILKSKMDFTVPPGEIVFVKTFPRLKDHTVIVSEETGSAPIDLNSSLHYGQWGGHNYGNGAHKGQSPLPGEGGHCTIEPGETMYFVMPLKDVNEKYHTVPGPSNESGAYSTGLGTTNGTQIGSNQTFTVWEAAVTGTLTLMPQYSANLIDWSDWQSSVNTIAVGQKTIVVSKAPSLCTNAIGFRWKVTNSDSIVHNLDNINWNLVSANWVSTSIITGFVTFSCAQPSIDTLQSFTSNVAVVGRINWAKYKGSVINTDTCLVQNCLPQNFNGNLSEAAEDMYSTVRCREMGVIKGVVTFDLPVDVLEAFTMQDNEFLGNDFVESTFIRFENGTAEPYSFSFRVFTAVLFTSNRETAHMATSLFSWQEMQDYMNFLIAFPRIVENSKHLEMIKKGMQYALSFAKGAQKVIGMGIDIAPYILALAAVLL